jgi:hypothetical protein
MNDESLAITMMYAAGVCGLLGLALPWAIRRASEAAAAGTAGLLAAAGTAALLISNAHMPAKYDIRADLLFLPPLLLAAWVGCTRLSIAALRQRSRRTAADAEPRSASGRSAPFEARSWR